MRNAISIDLEEWFHPEILRGRFQTAEWPALPARAPHVVARLLEILDEADVAATYFVLGWVAERHPEIVPRLAAAGHEVASHGYAHAMITQQTPEEFDQDLKRSLEILRGQSGQAVVGYRAPSFSVMRETLWAFDVMIEHGIEYDSSIYPVHHDRYGIPEAPRQPYRVARRGAVELWELPPPTLRIGNKNIPVAGGGYLRLLPYAVTAFALRRLNAQGIPGIVYTHPWEFDVQQPRVALPLLQKLRHYQNVGDNDAKLVRLLREFEWTTCAAVLDGIRQPATEPALA
jgi:polysaccharide deacetylase family protein (PEP-CTERM system associated)